MAGPNQSDFDAAELYKQTKARQANSQRLSAHLDHIWNDYDLEDLEVCYSVCGRIDDWAHEIRQLEDLLDRYRRAVSNLGGRVDE